MKINRTYSLDSEVVEALDAVGNASKFINDLLIEALLGNKTNNEQRLRDNIKKGLEEIKRIQEEIFMADDNLKRMEATKAELAEKFKGLPKQILNDFQTYDLTEEALYSRWQGLYMDLIDFNKLKYYWELYKKHEKEIN